MGDTEHTEHTEQTEQTEQTEPATHRPATPGHQASDATTSRPGRGLAVLVAVALLAAVTASGLTVGGLALWADAGTAPTSQPATSGSDGRDGARDAEDANGGNGANDGGEITQAATDGASDASLSTAEIADELAPSVAAVSVRGPRTSAPSSAQATAVVIDSEGYLVTNHHVVANTGPLSVTLADGSSYEAETVGSDPASDLAVLKVDADGLPAAELADETPAVGEPVVAIGSPFGLEGSVTSGIVSALDRSLPESDSVLVGLIQTDAAINPGNSGGPLVNDAGEVVGINTAIVSQSGTYSGVGFAVPAPVVSDVSQQLIDNGSIERAQLGIRAHTVEPRVAELYGLGANEGVLVAGVEQGSDAAGALEPGDVIVALDGEPVTDTADLVSMLMQRDPGDEVKLDVVRDGGERTVEVTLHAA